MEFVSGDVDVFGELPDIESDLVDVGEEDDDDVDDEEWFNAAKVLPKAAGEEP
jgi:hypothetical protein